MKLLILILFYLNSSYAYDWERCKHQLGRIANSTKLYGGLATSTAFPIQYISSWGGCSALGKPEEDRKAFFNENFELIKMDIARSGGEYSNVFIRFFKCTKKGKEQFFSTIRKNFVGNILDISDDQDKYISEEVAYKNIEKLILNENILKKECSDLNF